EVIADAEAHPLLHERVVLSRPVSGTCRARSGPSHAASHGGVTAAKCGLATPPEAGAVAPFRPYAEVRAEPEVLYVEISPREWIVQFVGFFLRHVPGDGWEVGDALTLREFKTRLSRDT